VAGWGQFRRLGIKLGDFGDTLSHFRQGRAESVFHRE